MQRSILPSMTLITVLSGAVRCEKTDRMLTGAERAVTSKTGHDVIDLALGKNPSQIAQKRLRQEGTDPEALPKDMRKALKDLCVPSLRTALKSRRQTGNK